MILSICIPSYNRFEELKKLLDSISESNSYKFDVFVIDNGSTENIYTIGEYDNRFKFIKRDTVVPGPVNVMSSLDYGDGEFVMLCLDKDFILGRYLDRFINELEKRRTISCGYCQLNSEINNGTIRINDIEIGKNFYRCGHPSGYFFRKDILAKATENLKPLDQDGLFYNNPFLIDLAYAYGLIDGKEGIYNGSLITTETLEKSSKTKSYTYTPKKGNIYFMPECRRSQMFLFLKHLDSLRLDNCKRKNIVRNLFRKTMSECTIGYKNIMSNKQICSHHLMISKDITVTQMINEAWILSVDFKKFETNSFSNMYKIKTIIYSWIILFIKIFLKNR